MGLPREIQSPPNSTICGRGDPSSRLGGLRNAICDSFCRRRRRIAAPRPGGCGGDRLRASLAASPLGRSTSNDVLEVDGRALERARARGPSEILSRRRGPARARHRGEDAPAGRPRRSPRKATAGEEVSTGQEGPAAAEPARPSRAVVTGSGGVRRGGSPVTPRRPGRGRGSTRPWMFERCVLEFGNAKILFKSHSTSY